MINNILYASTLSTLNYIDYTSVIFKIIVTKDKCKTKYAPEQQPIDIDILTIMGPQS